MSEFSERLKLLLTERDWTQRKLAQRCGLPESTICKYIIGERNPRMANLAKISKALDISVDYLTKGFEKAEELTLREMIIRQKSGLVAEQKLDLIRLLLK